MKRQCLARICLYLVSAAISIGQFDLLVAEAKPEEMQTAPRDPVEISRDQTALVRLTSKKVDEAKRVKAIVGLCKLFVEIGEHPEVDKDATLQRVSVELQTRLRGIENRLTNELRQRKIPEPESMIDAERAKRRAQSSWRMLPASEPTRTELTRSEPTLAASATRASDTTSDQSSSSTSESGASSESPGSTTNQTGLGGPGGIDDMGWWLVDLIRHTVQPAYWDTAGGPGTVVYYGPSRALVIRGSWRIHEAVADMLSALR